MLLTLAAAGCATVGRPKPGAFADRAPADATSVAGAGGRDPRALPIFDGRTGQSMDWGALLEHISGAEVIILGEQHDDAVAHAVQLAVVQDVAARPAAPGAAGAMKGAAWGGAAWKGATVRSSASANPPRWGALTMEMLERDEQHVLDDYLEGLIDAKTLAHLTLSESWAGEGSWANWYQPIIDAAAACGWRVIAGNAPRRYVTLARTEGYGVLMRLPADRRATFALPQTNPPGYYERFKAVMAHGHGVTTRPQTQPETQPTTQPATQPTTATAPASHAWMSPIVPPATQPPATQPATTFPQFPRSTQAAATQPATQPAIGKPAVKPTTRTKSKPPPVPQSSSASKKKPIPQNTKSTPPPAPKSKPKPPPTRTPPKQATSRPAAPVIRAASRPSTTRPAGIVTRPIAPRAGAAVAAGVPGENMDPGFRSQMLWDATMADSIARARRAGAIKVIHLAGQFHSDFAGGTVQELRARLPGVKILTISMQRDDGAMLLAEDRERADLVIYTGKSDESAPVANVPIDEVQNRTISE